MGDGGWWTACRRKETVRRAFLPQKRAAEAGVVRESRGIEGGEHGGGGDSARQVVAGDIEAPERRLVESWERAVEEVVLEAERDESLERGERRG